MKITRKGAYNGEMIFQEKKVFKGNLSTSVGNFTTEIKTKLLKTYIEENPLKLNINCEYLISISDIFEGRNLIEINVCEM